MNRTLQLQRLRPGSLDPSITSNTPELPPALWKCESPGVRQDGGKQKKTSKSGRNLANPEMLHENPTSQTWEEPWERSKREGGVENPGRKGGFVGIKIKAGIFLPLPLPPRFLGASFAPKQQPLSHPSSQGGLCKSSPSSQESGLIQHYRVEKGRKNLVEMAEPAEKIPP